MTCHTGWAFMGGLLSHIPLDGLLLLLGWRGSTFWHRKHNHKPRIV
jgi:hypothetical protein